MNTRTVCAAVALTLAAAHSAFAQGPLNPPGPPAATMKSLDQLDAKLEKRIDVLTLPGDESATHIIAQPGSYYLGGNITGSGKDGISIRASNVTLDLNGFAVDGNGAAGAGISAPQTSALANVIVRHGVVRGWGGRGVAHERVAKGRYEELHINGNGAGGIIVGIDSRISDCVVADNTGGNGITAPDGRCVVTGCIVSGNSGRGITAGAPGSTPAPNKTAVISGCSVSGNGGIGISAPNGSVITDSSALDNSSDGISAGGGSTIARCAAFRNRGVFGIIAQDGSTIVDCSASENISGGNESYGIFGHEGTTIANCSASANTNTNATADSLTGVGIFASPGSTITNCTARSNRGDGIRIRNGCVAVGNTVDDNGSGSASAAGIRSTGSNNRIEGNNVINNPRGIEVEGAGNLIVKNSASNNGPTNNLNYVIAADNRYGQVIDLTGANPATVNGNSATGTLGTTTQPWANFAY